MEFDTARIAKSFAGENTLQDFAFALIAFGAGLAAVRIAANIIKTRATASAKDENRKLLDCLFLEAERNIIPMMYFAVFYFSAQTLAHHKLENWIKIAAFAAFAIFGARFIANVAVFLIEYRRDGSKGGAAAFPQGIVSIIKVVVWGFALIFLLNNLGFNVSTLVAGLGIGGVAIALASQAVLGDLFSYFVILFDKPFEIGDFITFGDASGVVEAVGLKTTRVRSVSGEEIVISNSILLGARLHNFKRMEKRRAVLKLGVTYSTDSQTLRKIPEIAETIIKSVEGASFERASFVAFGDSALSFEIVYNVHSSDLSVFMSAQHSVNLGVLDEFRKSGIEFAFPTSTVILENGAKR